MLLLGASFGALLGEVLNLFLPSMGITSVACASVELKEGCEGSTVDRPVVGRIEDVLVHHIALRLT
jgi:hypothetical protein